MLVAVFEGGNKRRNRRMQLALWEGFNREGFARQKKLNGGYLQSLLNKLEPPRVMSPKAVREAVIHMAKAMGAKITVVKREPKP